MNGLRPYSLLRIFLAGVLLALTLAGCNRPTMTAQPDSQLPAGAVTAGAAATGAAPGAVTDGQGTPASLLPAQPPTGEPGGTAADEQLATQPPTPAATQTQPAGAEASPTGPNPAQPAATATGTASAGAGTPVQMTDFQGMPCAEALCQAEGTFLLQRPIGPQGRNTVVVSSRYGEYSRSLKGANHGAFFLNSTGTPVLAAADGEVVVAGNDTVIPYGPYKGHYGNLVILKHTLAGVEGPVYTLYGHLAEIEVKEKDVVSAGQEIGKVGSSGDIRGSTLVFEVRVGENNYQNARNPELWLEPLPGEDGQLLGALAGRIVDKNGDPLSIRDIALEHLAGPGLPPVETYYLKMYSEARIKDLAPWGESFAATGLPAGQYQVSFWAGGMRTAIIEIQPGRLALVTLKVE